MDAALPVRAFGNSAVLIALGALLLALSSAFSWHVAVTVIAIILLVLGAILLTLALLVTFRGRVRVSVDDEGYRLQSLGRTQERRWTEISRATITDDELRLYPRDEEHPDRVPLLDPARRPELDRLAEDVTERMRHAYGRLG